MHTVVAMTAVEGTSAHCNQT